MIPTVLGPIESSSVTGGCSPHERLLQHTIPSDIKDIRDTPITLVNLAAARTHPDRFAASNRLFSRDESVQELGTLADAGGALVLACSTVEEGRDPAGLADISRRSGMGVVMAASWAGSRLENMAWSDVDAAVDHSGDDLFGDARMDGAVRLPAYEQNLEGRGQQGFEGPEKTLEIEFDPDVGHEAGLRAIRREQWDAILEQSQCQILNHRGNEFFDSYVLSESSLFVYNSKLVLKTCGTTTLLRCLPLLAVVAKNYGLHLAWLGYSRKDFTFPTDQIYPHTSFAQEVDFLQTMFTGSAYVHGPLDNDHWYTYVADHCRRLTRAAADRTLNMMMYGLEPEVAQHFFRSDKIKTAEDVSWQSGIRAVLPRAELQDHLFEPCGYSMNALEGQAYYTVHVTPEPDFSYASFETNVRLPNYDDIVRGVLEVFRPNKFTMTLIADKSAMDNMKQNPFDADHIECAANRASPNDGARYRRTLKTTANFAGDYLSQMGNWVREVRDPAATGAAYL